MEKKKVSVETVVRTIVLVVTLLNQVLTMLGKNPLPFAEDELYSMLTAAEEVSQVISLAFTIGASIWAWWKNNSFTSAAIQADEYMKEIKHENASYTESED